MVLCLALAVAASAQQQMTENFDAGKPNNWELVDGAKIVQQQGMGKVLQFKNDGFAGWMVDLGQSFTLQMSMMVQEEGELGLVFLGSGEPPNHSEYELVHQYMQFRLMKMTNGQGTNLATAPGLQANNWASVSLQVNAGQITVRVNNQQVMTVSDPAPLKQGGIAFHGRGASIDNVQLTGVTGGMGGTQPISQPVGGQQGGGGGQMPVPVGDYSSGLMPISAGTTGVFLYVEGIQGGCTNQAFKNWIDCTDWEFEVGAMRAQNPRDHALTVSKHVSRSTPHLYQMASSGQRAQKARMLSVSNGQIVLDVVMEDVAVINAGRMMLGPTGQSMPANTEMVTLQGNRIHWYVPVYDQTGKLQGAQVGSYDYQSSRPVNF